MPEIIEAVNGAAEELARIADALHDNLQAYDDDGRERDINLVDAILHIGSGLRSPNEPDRNGEVSTIVDACYAIARAIDRLAGAVESSGAGVAPSTGPAPRRYERKRSDAVARQLEEKLR